MGPFGMIKKLLCRTDSWRLNSPGHRPGGDRATRALRHARHRPHRSSAAEETTIAQYRALAVLASLLRKSLAAPGVAPAQLGDEPAGGGQPCRAAQPGRDLRPALPADPPSRSGDRG